MGFGLLLLELLGHNPTAMVKFNLLIFALTLTGSTSAFADFCSDQALSIVPTDTLHNRWQIREFARTIGLPAFEVELSNGFTPVILINKKTGPRWKTLFENSMGIAQSLHPSMGADHGYTRLPGGIADSNSFEVPGSLTASGGWTPAVLMDLYSPGKAGANAAAGTGYRFKRLDNYFRVRSQTSDVYIDLAYAISKEDQKRVWLYHAAKRTALVRIQYAFDQHNNGWLMQQRRVLQQDLPESNCMISGGFEHCNNSRLAANADLHVREMRGRAYWLFNKPLNAVFNSPEGRSFLNQAKDDLLYRDWRDSNSYDPNFLSKTHYIDLMGQHLHGHLAWDQKVDALSYFLAINIFEEAISLRNQYEISEGRHNQYGNPKISAILIYSDQPESVGRFYDADARFYGARSGNGFDSNYFRTQKIHNTWSPIWREFLP